MRAIRYPHYGVLPQLEDQPRPQCPTDGVLVEVRATGVCRSDWHAWQGHDPVPLPHTPGHEFAGVIAEVGPEVLTRTVGERVTVPFVIGCGRCEWCLRGDAQVCPDQEQPGFTYPGSFAEVVAVPAADLNVVVIPDSVDFVTAAALGCRFATAYRALTAHGRIGAGEWVAMHGCGGVGLSALLVAVALGARVVAVDLSTAALALARELGAEHTVAAGDDASEEVRVLTDGGAHVSVDAVGSAETMRASLDSLRRRGRHIQIGLLLGRDAAPAIPMGRVIAEELEIYGSHGMSARDYPGMLELVGAGWLRPDRLVGQVVPLADAGHALDAMSRPATTPGVTVVDLTLP